MNEKLLTSVVNVHKTKMYDVYVGRAGKGQSGYFGNPVKSNSKCEFCDEVHREPGETLDCFKMYFTYRVTNDPEFRKHVLSLKGKILGCFCKPKVCHGDIIAEWVNNNLDTLE